MPFDFTRARTLLHAGDIKKLFVEELGWEPGRQRHTLRVADRDYEFTAMAVKRGFTVWKCAGQDGKFPDHGTRLKLDRALTQTSFEHLIVFVTQEGSRQSWTWVRREPGRPLVQRNHEFSQGQAGDSLLQKLQALYVSLEEEEEGDLSTIAIAGRARAAFDLERVTKAFYRDFDTHRKTFVKLIDGIGVPSDREWYASVMLNRLMFVYFIQRKGFLDGDGNYLRNRLDRCKREQGRDKFYNFYRYFLLRLFHEGFAKRRSERAADLEKLIGNIPYLNGGLFDMHDLERPDRYGKDIQIPDKAFERIFDYFDKYQWHLDERPLRDDNEINPDVLGHIFEKYINQKQMGAYYTKEDITDYIGQSTIIPALLDGARKTCGVAFDNPSGPSVWDLLRENPDRYMHPATRHGLTWDFNPERPGNGEPRKDALSVPREIAAGVADPTRRDGWDRPAPEPFALATETWREVMLRRQRYDATKQKLAGGEVRSANDLVTLNLDLSQFAQDSIQNCEGPDLLMAFWQSVSTITVLDPTGGSGAFLFAALNILDPLYDACLDRMEGFLTEWGDGGARRHPNYHRKFTEVLARVAAHPNRRYFVLKSIVLNNLYAVDIMEEAVEICKLRLFLKLASQVTPDSAKDNWGIEPLPDIDFNIRPGNTLIGYANYEEAQRAIGSSLDFDDTMGKISAKAAALQETFDRFRHLQTEGDGAMPATEKQDLQERLRALEDELNHHMAGEYGVNVRDKAAYRRWQQSHQPFHWFIHFYGILNGGGFDVIIGNPPYVEYKDVKDDYTVKGYATEECGNLYAYCWERSVKLATSAGRVGLIIPVASVCTDGYASLRKVWTDAGNVVASNFNDRPGKLFDGLEHIRLAIVLLEKSQSGPRTIHSTTYSKWPSEARTHLFHTLTFTETTGLVRDGSMPKLGSMLEAGILRKVSSSRRTLQHFALPSGRHRILYTRKLSWFVQIMDFVPSITDGRGRRRDPSELKEVLLESEQHRNTYLCALNSSMFYWLLTVWSDCRNLNKREVLGIPLDFETLDAGARAKLDRLAARLSKSLQDHSEILEMNYKEWGTMKIQCIYPRHSKALIDEIDAVLAKHYGLTPEELDFIVNCDIKYRMGRDNGGAE